jgi:FG-GAP repeat
MLHQQSGCENRSPIPCDLPKRAGARIASGDLDDDGRPDLVVADRNYYDSNVPSRIYVLGLGR